MQRTQIYLSTAINTVLERQAKKTGLSKSELIRGAIEKVYLGARGKTETLQALRDSAGAWQRDENGRAFVEKIRPGRLAERHRARPR